MKSARIHRKRGANSGTIYHAISLYSHIKMTVNQELLDTRRVQRQCIEITLTLFGRPPQDMDKTTLQQPQKGWRVALMPPWAPRHIDGSRQRHPRYTDARNNVHGGRALLSPSSAKIQQRTERRYVGQEVDGLFVGSRKQPRQRTQGHDGPE